MNDWWWRGSETDAYWQSLSWKNRMAYDIGQTTLDSKTYNYLGCMTPVERGNYLIANRGFLRALLGISPENWHKTWDTGPTPLVRFAGRLAVGEYTIWQTYSWLTGRGSGEDERR